MKRILILPSALAFFALTAGAVQAAPVKINFWEQSPPDTGAEIDKWITVFQKSNPNIQVVRQHYENEELRTKFLRSSVTGDGADIVSGPNDVAGVFATAGVIQPVDGMIKADRFTPKSLDMARINGKVWGVPLNEGNHLLLYYNKDLVKNPPANTKDLIAQAKAFTNEKQNKYGLAFFQSEPFWFVSFLHGFGGSALQVNGKDVKVTIDTPEMQKALQFLVDLKDKEKILPKECNVDCAKSMFLSGNALFHISGDWELVTYAEKLGDKLGIAPLPVISETGKPMAPMLGGLFLYVNAGTKDKELEATRKFLQFLTSKQVQLRVATKLNKIPVTLEARADAAVKKNAILNASVNAAAIAHPMPPQVEMRAAWDGMRIMVQRALSGKESVAQAVKTGQKAADEALKGIQQKPVNETEASADARAG
ncbi:sugar ABC transporter substrate-binding protein [Oligoflexus tunisiensis]|uniref:sugar ABC transporter substrate-binding protein n=1 Tax=Oligoflexus tunisiensis TaxID=708132 RepID=UPI000ADBE0EF|nr:extracellular solute-binding protein [Oligoflexus tunisiensis]